MSETIPGINIQWPWSEMIVSGKKTVETRSYKLPDKFIGKRLAVIETPGPRGKREAGIEKARIIGTVVFSGSFRYESKEDWLGDCGRHCVDAADRQFGFSQSKEKWGWTVAEASSFGEPMPAPVKRGIVFATLCSVVSEI
jgi:hypothetical protein